MPPIHLNHKEVLGLCKQKNKNTPRSTEPWQLPPSKQDSPANFGLWESPNNVLRRGSSSQSKRTLNAVARKDLAFIMGITSHASSHAAHPNKEAHTREEDGRKAASNNILRTRFHAMPRTACRNRTWRFRNRTYRDSRRLATAAD